MTAWENFLNGITFSASGTFFIYAETYRRRLWKVEWDEKNLEIKEEHIWAKTSGHWARTGSPSMRKAICTSRFSISRKLKYLIQTDN